MKTKTMKQLIQSLLFLLVVVACAPTEPARDTSGERAESLQKGPQKEVHVIAPNVSGGATVTRIQKRGKLLVATSGAQPPFTMKDTQGNLLGLEIDLARAFARSLEVEIEFVELPFGEVLGAVQSQKVDLALSSITMTPKRNLDVAFIGPYFVSGKALLTKDQNLSKIEEPQALDRPQVRLGALKGSTSELLIGKAAPRAKLETFETYEQGVEAVTQNKIHALVADLPLVAVTLLQHPDAGFAAVGDPLSFEPIGVAVPAADAHFHNLLGNYLELMEGLGYLEALRARWFGQADWLGNLPPGHSGKPLDPGGRFSM